MADGNLILGQALVTSENALKRRHPRSRLRTAVTRPAFWFGGGFLLLLAVLAIFAPWIAPSDPLDQDLASAMQPPFGLAGGDVSHILGSDDLGRDALSRLIFGSRVALTVSIVAALLAAAIGTTLGLLAGYLGGWVDRLISRVVEIWLAFPAVLLSILIVAIIGPGLVSGIIAIAFIDWTRFARVIRAETMAQAQADYVTAAVVLGFRPGEILLREILPNVVPTLMGLIAMEMGIAVVVEAILSFIGLSLSSDVPTWGGMIASGRQIIHEAWWIFAAPLVLVLATVLAFNALGDVLRSAVDPLVQE